MESILDTLIRLLESFQNRKHDSAFTVIAVLLSDFRVSAIESGKSPEYIAAISTIQKELRDHYFPDAEYEIPVELRGPDWTPQNCIISLRGLALLH